MDSNPLSTFINRLPLFFAWFCFWFAPGLATIALYDFSALITLEVPRLLLFSAAIPVPIVSLTFFAISFRRADFEVNNATVMDATIDTGIVFYITIAIAYGTKCLPEGGIPVWGFAIVLIIATVCFQIGCHRAQKDLREKNQHAGKQSTDNGKSDRQ